MCPTKRLTPSWRRSSVLSMLTSHLQTKYLHSKPTRSVSQADHEAFLGTPQSHFDSAEASKEDAWEFGKSQPKSNHEKFNFGGSFAKASVGMKKNCFVLLEEKDQATAHCSHSQELLPQ